MSDPQTNVEIEDVLSSIRRLVSMEAPSDTRFGGPSSPQGDDQTIEASSSPTSSIPGDEVIAQPKATEPKLVLTPAQRVIDVPTYQRVGSEDEEAPLTLGGQTEAVPSDVDSDAQPADTQDEVFESPSENEISLEENEEQHGADPHPLDEETVETPDQDEWHSAEDGDLYQAPDASPEDDPIDASADHSVETTDVIPEETLQDMIAEEIDNHLSALSDEPLDAQSTETSAPAENTSFDDDSAGPDVPEFVDRAVVQTDPFQETDNDDGIIEVEVIEGAQSQRTLSEKLETLEEAVARQPDEWEPDGDEEESFAAEAIEPLPWSDIDFETANASENATDTGTVESVADTANSDQPLDPESKAGKGASDWFGDDAVLDEEALRDMVGEIVRQELQGALGERITRNVRKLVRREIHRALIAHGID